MKISVLDVLREIKWLEKGLRSEVKWLGMGKNSNRRALIFEMRSRLARLLQLICTEHISLPGVGKVSCAYVKSKLDINDPELRKLLRKEFITVDFVELACMYGYEIAREKAREYYSNAR